MTCPKCNTELLLAERQRIEIDYCPQCRGVWLDRGELDKIIERNLEAEARPQHRDWDDDDRGFDRSRHYKPGKKKGGLLGELFDF